MRPLCSLSGNDIGREGAKYIGEMLKDNTTLQILECVPPVCARAPSAHFAYALAFLRASTQLLTQLSLTVSPPLTLCVSELAATTSVLLKKRLSG